MHIVASFCYCFNPALRDFQIPPLRAFHLLLTSSTWSAETQLSTPSYQASQQASIPWSQRYAFLTPGLFDYMLAL